MQLRSSILIQRLSVLCHRHPHEGRWGAQIDRATSRATQAEAYGREHAQGAMAFLLFPHSHLSSLDCTFFRPHSLVTPARYAGVSDVSIFRGSVLHAYPRRPSSCQRNIRRAGQEDMEGEMTTTVRYLGAGRPRLPLVDTPA